ncbi:LysR family transcriptional regulator [Reyranella soli]|uniref:HTH lysR-type domain-containing protein n=1 Tax=Reyranella soli TaxID=1230389 RepID=A0A512NS41_9HYPH|nr:LysR family transcriptional regulator [Reyranella soli]GEP61757.1 hypothetical protein RSO01_89230 [Reyranella soli]
MAKAAAELAIAQPAVSRAIADIERTLGVRLLDRGHHGIEPTPLATGCRAASHRQFGKRGSRSASGRDRPIHPAASGIRLDVAQTVLGTFDYRELRERKIDLWLGWTPANFAAEDLVVESLLNDPRVVVAGKQSRWVRFSRLDLAYLADEPWILPPPDTFPGAAVAELFRAGGVDMPPTPLTTLSIHLCCRLSASGKFIALLPSSIVKFGGRDLDLKTLPIELPRTSMFPRPS